MNIRHPRNRTNATDPTLMPAIAPVESVSAGGGDGIEDSSAVGVAEASTDVPEP